MQRFARVVLGYHGCLEPMATALLTGETPIEAWPPSENPWDWLGDGIYFWEHSPERALRWARNKAKRSGVDPSTASVVGAVLQLGRCFDLTDVAFTQLLGAAYEQIHDAYEIDGKTLPSNRGATDLAPRRELDRLIINYCLSEVLGDSFQTVRGAFWEGKEAFPGAAIREESHIQIAVRERSCILGIFRPTL